MFTLQKFNRAALTAALLAIAGLGGGCSALDRLAALGEKPALTAIENPTAQPGYKPVQMPMPKPEPASYNANSLWRNGSPRLSFECAGPQPPENTSSSYR